MSIGALLNRTTHKNLLMQVLELGAGRVSISCAILTTSFLNLSSARCYGRIIGKLVAIVRDVAYTIWIIEVRDSDNVSNNYGEPLPDRILEGQG